MSEPGGRQRVALITGGSRGIGRACAVDLSRDGFYIVVTYNTDEKGANQTVETIRQEGGAAECVKADAGSAEETQALCDRLDRERDGVDVLVNNAAVLKNVLFAMMSEASWNRPMEVAMGGTFRTTKGVIRGMLRRRWGRVINITSLAAMVGSAGQTNYAAAKGAIISFTKSLAAEVAGYGVTANCVAPGFIETEMIAWLKPEVREGFIQRIPARRFGQPGDVSPLVRFLCTDGAGYINGQTIRVDGAFVA